jgi:hypothetical protein
MQQREDKMLKRESKSDLKNQEAKEMIDKYLNVILNSFIFL